MNPVFSALPVGSESGAKHSPSFSLLDGPSGKNPRFYKFVCICTFHCEIKAALLEHPGATHNCHFSTSSELP